MMFEVCASAKNPPSAFNQTLIHRSEHCLLNKESDWARREVCPIHLFILSGLLQPCINRAHRGLLSAYDNFHGLETHVSLHTDLADSEVLLFCLSRAIPLGNRTR